jgi:hypothetical protein
VVDDERRVALQLRGQCYVKWAQRKNLCVVCERAKLFFYILQFCACRQGRVPTTNLWAGNVCFYVSMSPENKPVDTT